MCDYEGHIHKIIPTKGCCLFIDLEILYFFFVQRTAASYIYLFLPGQLQNFQVSSNNAAIKTEAARRWNKRKATVFGDDRPQ